MWDVWNIGWQRNPKVQVDRRGQGQRCCGRSGADNICLDNGLRVQPANGNRHSIRRFAVHRDLNRRTVQGRIQSFEPAHVGQRRVRQEHVRFGNRINRYVIRSKIAVVVGRHINRIGINTQRKFGVEVNASRVSDELKGLPSVSRIRGV